MSTENVSAFIHLNEIRQGFICPVISSVLTDASTLTTHIPLHNMPLLNWCNHPFEALKLSTFSCSEISVVFACTLGPSMDMLSLIC
jgi:hypothetical protein